MSHIHSPSLKCEINIIRAKNLEFAPAGNLFVRYYLVDDDSKGKRIRLNSREIASTCDPYWNESLSLECHGATDTAMSLRLQIVAFELRWRSSNPVVGRILGSKVLGRAVMSWKEVLESKDGSIEKWVEVAVASGNVVGLKPPALQLGMKVEVLKKVEMAKGREIWKECNCCSCRYCEYGRDEEILAITAAFELI